MNMVLMGMDLQLNVIGLICSVALFVDNAIWWRAAFLHCAKYVIQLIALLVGSSHLWLRLKSANCIGMQQSLGPH